jgi:nitrogen fixation protein FixH
MTVNRVTGRHVLYALVAFFSVMLLANGVFVYLAVSTFGGIDTPDAYRKGLAYNETLAEAEAQAKRGWSARIAPIGNAQLRITITDRAGLPVTGLTLSGRLLRPATNRFDLELTEFIDRGNGIYETSLTSAQSGAWIAEIEARGSGMPLRMRERLWLAPNS